MIYNWKTNIFTEAVENDIRSNY